MYAARYFPASYFAPRYFPKGVRTKPGYFLHSYFPKRYFADRYFPGHIPVLVTPPEPPITVVVGVGGRPSVHRFDQIALAAELQFPDITLQSLLQVRPALVQALLDGALDGPHIQALLRAEPSKVDIVAAQSLSLAFESFLYVDRPRRTHTEDEDLLLMHYLLSLKDDA